MSNARALAMIRRRRATRPLIKRVPVQAHPVNIAREYSRALTPMLQSMHAITIAAVMPFFRDVPDRQDAPSKVEAHGATIGRAIEGAKVDVYRTITEKRTGLIAQGIGGKVRRFTENAIGQQIKAVIGLNPLDALPALSNAILDNFAQANVSLIKTVPERYFDQITGVVQESLAIGRRAEDVSALLQDRYDVSVTNADRIARDQVSKLNASITETRHKDLGVDAYFWRTSNDERVRDTHAENEGERFEYADPPAETGNPGDDVNCFPGETAIDSQSAVHKFYWRWSRCQLTEIVTSDREALRATANHPILTDSGWKRAHAIKIGDYLVEAPVQEIDFFVTDPKRRNPSFVELAIALDHMGVTPRVTSLARGFHGDAIDEQISVVDMDRGLSAIRYSEDIERFRDHVLAFADDSALRISPLYLCFDRIDAPATRIVRGGCKILSLLIGKTRVSQEHCFRAVPWIQSTFAKLAHDCRTGAIEVHGHFEHGDPGFVHFRKLIARECYAIIRALLMDSSRLNSASAQGEGKCIAVDDEDLSHVRDRMRPEKYRRVVEKNVGELAWRHVFNLGTRDHTYHADNRVVHNCRCRAEPDLSAFFD